MTQLQDSRDAELGYRTVGGKALRMQQWAERREEQAFARLVNCLNVKRWTARVYAENGARLRQLRKVKAQHAARKAVAQREARRGRISSCPQCGAQWCRVPNVPGNKQQFCSRKCARVGEWLRLKERRRAPCRGCGGVKPAGQGVVYCAYCTMATDVQPGAQP